MGRKKQERKVYQCGNCGMAGHNRATCPSEPVVKAKPSVRQYCCRLCGEPGHNAATCGNPPVVRNPGRPGRPKKTPEQYRAFVSKKYPGMCERMGTVSDTVLAEQYGLTRQRVQQFRKAMDIDPKNNGFHPTPEQVALLGTKSDSDLAREWGVSTFHVGQYRRNNGIPRWQVWDDHEEKLAPHKHLIGKISDPKVAALCGLSTRCVFEYRKRHNIKTEVLAPTHEDFSPIDREEIEELFNEGHSDVEIAEIIGCSAGTVGVIRSSELGLLRNKPKRPTTEGEREKIRRIYENCEGNLSETARRSDRSVTCIRSIVGR